MRTKEEYNKYYRDYYKKNKEKIAAKNAKWKGKNPEKCKEYAKRSNEKHRLKRNAASTARRNTIEGRARSLCANAKDRANKQGLDYNINPDDVINKIKLGVCEKTGLNLDLSEGDRSLYSPSLDRVVPELGYIDSNVRVICWGYNMLKNIYTDEETDDFIQKIARYKGTK